jgi:hypothetical protein
MSLYISDPQVQRRGNTIVIRDLKSPHRIGDIVSAVYKGRADLSTYQDVIFEIEDGSAAFPNSVVPLAALVSLYRRLGLRVIVRTESQFYGLSEIGAPLPTANDAEINAPNFFSHIWEFSDSESVNRLVNATIARVTERTECSTGVLEPVSKPS